MKYGLLLPMFGELCDPAFLRDFAQAAEGSGFESLWMGDHIALPTSSDSQYPYKQSKSYSMERGSASRRDRWDVFTALSYVAAVTESITIGTSVLVTPYRHPLVTAKMLSSLDVLSSGRLEVGLGAGWLEEEFEALGQTLDERGRRTDETVEIWIDAWAGKPIEHSGEFFEIHGVAVEPTPIDGRIPLALGGHSRHTLRRVVEYGSGWHMVSESPSQCYGWSSTLEGSVNTLQEQLEAVGRSRADVLISAVILEGEAASASGVANSKEQYWQKGVGRLILDYPAATASSRSDLMDEVDRLTEALDLTQTSVDDGRRPE